jgi:hypothetical protein
MLVYCKVPPFSAFLFSSVHRKIADGQFLIYSLWKHIIMETKRAAWIIPRRKYPRRRPTVTSSLKGQCHEISDFWFFHESVSPKPLSIPIGSFRIFSKIRGDIRSSTCTTGVVDTGGK